MRKVISIDSDPHLCDYAELQRPIEMPRRRRADKVKWGMYDNWLAFFLVLLGGAVCYAVTWVVLEICRP